MTHDLTVVTAIGPAQEAAVAEYLSAASDITLVRRCADLGDLLAVAEAARVSVAVVSAGFPGLDRSAIARLREYGVIVVGVVSPWDDHDALAAWAVPSASLSAGPQELLALVRAAEVPDGAQPALEADVPEDPPPAGSGEDCEDGIVVVVWGPPGAPGRTTLAVNLAAELAAGGVSTLLVDADTYAASVAQHLALLDEAPGVAAATRLADAGRLDVRSLAAVAPVVLPDLRVLTGLPRADRWPEVRDESFTHVLQVARGLVAVTVVDVAAPLEEDEDLSYDTRAPRRNAATLAALRTADRIIAVGAGDPVGLQRLVRGLADLAAIGKNDAEVVVTKVRTSAVGSHAESVIADSLDRFAAVTATAFVPDDRAALDGGLLAGRVLRECAPTSPARRAIADLATRFGAVAPRSRRRRLGRRG
ncbi:cellulose biosynthesis protein BcsQ [Branchiibius hedensis]|uniref:Cellulose biosynthesis protein BcsQ n=1 Tax=Branchiibius hedensis TaxID=672460 RepID=A0A2Y8ZX18_9MICO|nr:hypothetical protein [Branchiibius hedensis]PWJ25997.1 cellulose biosynthesis protein BcsQ [Branchiibius hedensis]SSA34809.1 Cellulose biosynthesis protein BcsQ [Branchiibius hedensis]